MHAWPELLLHALVVARWQAAGSPRLVIARNERGQPYATVVDLGGYLRHACATPLCQQRAAVVAQVGCERTQCQ